MARGGRRAARRERVRDLPAPLGPVMRTMVERPAGTLQRRVRMLEAVRWAESAASTKAGLSRSPTMRPKAEEAWRDLGDGQGASGCLRADNSMARVEEP